MVLQIVNIFNLIFQWQLCLIVYISIHYCYKSNQNVIFYLPVLKALMRNKHLHTRSDMFPSEIKQIYI